MTLTIAIFILVTLACSVVAWVVGCDRRDQVWTDNLILRTALQDYADANNWHPTSEYPTGCRRVWSWDEEGCQRAREALGLLEAFGRKGRTK